MTNENLFLNIKSDSGKFCSFSRYFLLLQRHRISATFPWWHYNCVHTVGVAVFIRTPASMTFIRLNGLILRFNHTHFLYFMHGLISIVLFFLLFVFSDWPYLQSAPCNWRTSPWTRMPVLLSLEAVSITPRRLFCDVREAAPVLKLLGLITRGLPCSWHTGRKTVVPGTMPKVT